MSGELDNASWPLCVVTDWPKFPWMGEHCTLSEIGVGGSDLSISTLLAVWELMVVLTYGTSFEVPMLVQLRLEMLVVMKILYLLFAV